MAHTKASGTSKNGRDSNPKYRGLKLHDGQIARIGSILVRQMGSSFWPGEGVRQGTDYTLYSVADGKVKFATKKKIGYNGKRRTIKVINVV